MTTRSSRRGKLQLLGDAVPEAKKPETMNPPARSRRGKQVLDSLIENTVTEIAVKPISPRTILNEICDNIAKQQSSGGKRRVTRSKREDINEDVSKIPTLNVTETRRKTKNQTKKNILSPWTTVNSHVLAPVEYNSRSLRNKNKTSNQNISAHESAMDFQTTKNKSKKNNSKKHDSENAFIVSIPNEDDRRTSLPSKRGSTGNLIIVQESENVDVKCRKPNRKNIPTEALKLTRRTTRRTQNVGASNTPPETKVDKNISNASNETSYHSVRGSINLLEDEKEQPSFTSILEFDDASALKHSSFSKKNSLESATIQANNQTSNLKTGNGDSIVFLDDTNPILVDDSITSDDGKPKGKDSTFDKSDSQNDSNSFRRKFVIQSNKILRISGVEEIPLTRTVTSLKRDGTFTKENSINTKSININDSNDFELHKLNEVSNGKRHVFSASSPCKTLTRNNSQEASSNASALKTPLRSLCRAVSVGSAGCTPAPFLQRFSTASSQTITSDKTSNVTPRNSMKLMNVTHSIEKPENISSIQDSEDISGKARGKVAFSSPKQDRDSALSTKKIIKSSMKGSNKSFLFSSSSRKRSLTLNDTEARQEKIPRISEKELTFSISRLSRPKTAVSEVKAKYTPKTKFSTCGSTPAKLFTGLPAVPASRGKMPNFASLHKKQFEQMESLTQNKERKEQRAKQLLFSSVAPKCLTVSKTINIEDPNKPINGFNRFGFKLATEPLKFNFSAKPDNSVKKTLPLPSLTKSKKTEARQAVMREERPSVAEKKRKENRDYVKGVRTNRRFELQMQSRNLAA